MIKDVTYYCKKFSAKVKATNSGGLNVNAKMDTAPLKPILLLSIIELISTGSTPRTLSGYSSFLIRDKRCTKVNVKIESSK